MIEKLEKMMDFVFKMVQWVIIIIFIAFIVIFYKSCTTTLNHIDNPKQEVVNINKK